MIPVLKIKCAEWEIPRVGEAQLRQDEDEELRIAKWKFRNTTPIGREIYRKTLCGIRSKLSWPGAKIKEVVKYAQEEFRAFPTLAREFQEIFSLGKMDADPSSITIDGMAIILVVTESAKLKAFGPEVRNCRNSSFGPLAQVRQPTEVQVKNS